MLRDDARGVPTVVSGLLCFGHHHPFGNVPAGNVTLSFTEPRAHSQQAGNMRLSASLVMRSEGVAASCRHEL